MADNGPRCATHAVSLANEAFFRCGCCYYGAEASPARELSAAHLRTIRDLANARDGDDASIVEITLRAALAETLAEIDRLRAPRPVRGTTRAPWPTRDELAALAAVIRDQREADDRRDPAGVPVEAPKGHVMLGLVDRELDTLERALSLLVDGAPNVLGVTTEGNSFSAYANEVALLALRTGAKAVYGFVVDGDRGTGGMPLVAGLTNGPEYRARCMMLADLLRRSAAMLTVDVDRQVGEVKP